MHYTENVVRRLISFVAVLLLLLTAAPLMACVTEQSMTHEEQACCRLMKNQCGQMEMPASHGCCQKDSQAAHQRALQIKAVDLHCGSAAVMHSEAVVLWQPVLNWAGWLERSEFSPPQSLPSSISILRI